MQSRERSKEIGLPADASDVERDPLLSGLWLKSEARGNAEWLAGQASVVEDKVVYDNGYNGQFSRHPR